MTTLESIEAPGQLEEWVEGNAEVQAAALADVIGDTLG